MKPSFKMPHRYCTLIMCFTLPIVALVRQLPALVGIVGQFLVEVDELLLRLFSTFTPGLLSFV